MGYLTASEYESFGLDAATPEMWVTMASALMDAYCRRATLSVSQYVERARLLPGRMTARLSYLPVTQIVSARGRYAEPRGGDDARDIANDIALAFSLPGSWTTLDTSVLEFTAETGELTVPRHPLGLAFNEIETTYTAGLEPLPQTVKIACAQIVRNALATPALNVRASSLDRMHLDYFSDTLLDSGTRALLAPHVAQKVG